LSDLLTSVGEALHLLEKERRDAERKCASSDWTEADAEEFRVRWLGQKRGLVTGLLDGFRTVPKEEKARVGQALNELKRTAERFSTELHRDALLLSKKKKELAGAADVTFPPRVPPVGRLHPLTVVRRRIEAAFRRLGYEIADGPEIESDWYNFESLNFPPDHPARDVVDTFFVEGGGTGKDRLLLRTHTSPVQMRTMLSRKPPIRIICPGRAYRKDDIDPRHSPVFHQVEGLAVDEDITFADLKGTLAAFSRMLFSSTARVRFGPTFFPFVEPGVEVAVSCVFCRGTGVDGEASCRPCSASGWIEIMGAGMVHPGVLANGGIDPGRYTGFAFGMGIDRIAMLVHGIPDLRLLFENDARFLDRVWE
jgi:phenylalanyl-tRNA synthetase alpha chain